MKNIWTFELKYYNKYFSLYIQKKMTDYTEKSKTKKRSREREREIKMKKIEERKIEIETQ